MAALSVRQWLGSIGASHVGWPTALLVGLTLIGGCGDELVVTASTNATSPTTSSTIAPDAPIESGSTTLTSTVPVGNSSSSTMPVEPKAVADLGAPSHTCLPEGTELALARDIALELGSGADPYIPDFTVVHVEAGAHLTVTTLDQRVDLDDDGADESIQYFAIETNEGVGEGFRVCGSSRQLELHYNGPSNGNFGVVPVRLDGPDGIANRPPAPDVGPEDVWLYSPEGILLPPYARDPASSNLPKRRERLCFPYSSGERTDDTYLAVERGPDGVAGSAALVGFEVIEIETFDAGDFDGDGQPDVVQTFLFHGDAGARVAGARVCGPGEFVDDWLQLNGNKPIGFSPPSPSDTVLHAAVASGAGIYRLEFRVTDGALVVDAMELTRPEQ